MSSLPLVFSSDEKVVSTTDWYISLSRDEETYKNCFVRRITHIKNLKSWVLHEFIQVIFEDKSNDNGDRTRVLAERQTKQDQLIFGRWSYGPKPGSKADSIGKSSGTIVEDFTDFFRGSSSSSSSDGDGGTLPLPLLSLTFDNNLSVLQFAQICLKTTEQLGTYNLITRNCYCFAAIVYEAARLKYAGVVKDWPYASLKGKLALWTKYDNKAKKEGEVFKQEEDKDFQWAPSGAFEQSLARFWTEAIKLLRAEGVELSDDEVDELASSCKLYDRSDAATEQAIKKQDAQELDTLYQDTVEKVLTAPHVDGKIAVYQRYASGNPEPALPEIPDGKLPSLEIYKVSSDLEEKNAKALEVLIGGVLQEIEASV